MIETGAFTRYSDIFSIKNTNQVLKLKIDEQDRYLIKGDSPIGVVWRGDQESSAFYAYLANSNEGTMDSKGLEKMNNALHDKIETSDSPMQVVSPLLDILENGWYQIFYHEPNPFSVEFKVGKERPKYFGVHHFNFNLDCNFNINRSPIWVDNSIIFTQDFSKLDPERVDHYKQSIAQGRRPTIITLAVANFGTTTYSDFIDTGNELTRIDRIFDEALSCINPQFIIDGHHKAKAYIEMKEKASIISIVKLQFEKENAKFEEEKEQYKRNLQKQIGLRIV